MESFKAPASLDLFFKRVHEITQIAKRKSLDEKSNEKVREFAADIYQKLHELYKTQEEYEKEINTSIINDSNTCMPS